MLPAPNGTRLLGCGFDGQRYTQRILSLKDGGETELDYDESNRQLLERKGLEETRFFYDEGFFAFESPEERREFILDPVTSLVDSAKIIDKKAGVTEKLVCKYNASKNLIGIESSVSGTLSLKHDPMGNLVHANLNGEAIHFHRSIQLNVETISIGDAGEKLKVEWDSVAEGFVVQPGQEAADTARATELMKRIRDLTAVVGKYRLL